MSHPEQQEFVSLVRRRHPQYFKGRRVLEVGSLEVNGGVRHFFQNCRYTGIDLGPGPGVDLVCHATRLTDPGGPFEVVISCEALEHDQLWSETVVHAQSLLRAGGILIVTCAGPKRLIHGTSKCEPECSPYTLDWYQNLGRSHLETLLRFPAFWDCDDLDTRFYMIKGLD